MNGKATVGAHPVTAGRRANVQVKAEMTGGSRRHRGEFGHEDVY
jgi:hypothetical protein